MRKLIIAFIVLFTAMVICLPGSLFAQSSARLSGKVLDSSLKPLSFVTVRFYKQKDLLNPFQTTYTKEDGSFKFTKLEFGNYTLVFTHTGFAEKQQAVTLTPAVGDVTINDIQLSSASRTLEGVTIIKNMPLIEQADDKIVFNVENDPTAKTETAIDILRKTPFISVDGEDNVQVNGQRNFKVLLNGRETSMFARNLKEALRGFPGALISKIEVITSPSAKYDGEGIGGLINIITKKKIVGYNGTLSSFSRTIDKLNTISLNANAKFGKIGTTLLYVIGDSRPVDQESSAITVPVIPSVYTQRALEGNRRNSSRWNFGNSEISWEIDSLNTLSTYANINSGSNRSLQAQTIKTDFNSAGSTVSFFSLDNKNENPGISVGTDYIRRFKKNKDKELSVRFFGEFGKTSSFLNSSQDNPGTDRFIINNSIAHNNQYTIQADYIIPLKKNVKFESGVKAILRRANSNFESLIKYDLLNDYKMNPANTDHFKYIQDVFSVYGMYSVKVKKTNFRFGSRLEHTGVNGNFISSKTLVDQSYITLLPNIQATTRMNDVLTMVLSYNKRLQRPYIWDLNPFINNNDSFNIEFGNPGLGPQTIHTVSAQTRYIKGSTFGGITIEGSYSDNKILDYSSFDLLSGVTKTTSLNIGKEFQSGLNLNVNSKINKLTFFINASIRYINITNKFTAHSSEGIGYGFTTHSSYKFSKKFTISSFVGLWKDPASIQTEYPFNTWYNLALNHKFLKEKLNVSLRAVNFLEKTRDFRRKLTDPIFHTTNVQKQIRRGIALALTWNFGKLTENVSKKRGVNNDDLLNKRQTEGNN